MFSVKFVLKIIRKKSGKGSRQPEKPASAKIREYSSIHFKKRRPAVRTCLEVHGQLLKDFSLRVNSSHSSQGIK
jgi:hypothetical protein